MIPCVWCNTKYNTINPHNSQNTFLFIDFNNHNQLGCWMVAGHSDNCWMVAGYSGNWWMVAGNCWMVAGHSGNWWTICTSFCTFLNISPYCNIIDKCNS
jgi:hypothetical protein